MVIMTTLRVKLALHVMVMFVNVLAASKIRCRAASTIEEAASVMDISYVMLAADDVWPLKKSVNAIKQERKKNTYSILCVKTPTTCCAMQ